MDLATSKAFSNLEPHPRLAASSAQQFFNPNPSPFGSFVTVDHHIWGSATSGNPLQQGEVVHATTQHPSSTVGWMQKAFILRGVASFLFAAGFLNSLGKKAWEHLLHNSDASAKPSEGGDVFYLEAPSWSCIPKQPHPDFSWRIAALRSGFQPAIPSAAHCSAALLHCCLLFFLKTNILRS